MLPSIHPVRLASVPEPSRASSQGHERPKTSDHRPSALKPQSAGGNRSKTPQRPSSTTRHVAFPDIVKDTDGISTSVGKNAETTGHTMGLPPDDDESLHASRSAGSTFPRTESSRSSRSGTASSLKGLFKFSVQDFVRGQDAKMGVIPMYLQEKPSFVENRPSTSSSRPASSRGSSAGRESKSASGSSAGCSHV
jgi:hypothetical protein